VTDKLTISFMAADKKATGMTVNIPELTDLNFQLIGTGILALHTALRSLTESGASKTTTSITNSSDWNANDRAGLRGQKLVVRWYASGANEGEGQYGSNECGTAQLSDFTLQSDGRYLLEGLQYTALKEAFEAIARSDDGATVEVYEVEFVTRTL
jgi:hypothetical protein